MLKDTNSTRQPSPVITGRRVISPDAMRPEEREKLCRELYEVHSRIFAGVTLDRFRLHVIEPDAAGTLIQLILGQGAAVVGYVAFHRFYRTIQGRRTVVIRAEAGLEPSYRGRGVTMWFGMVGALKEKLRHPTLPVYYLGTLVHPSSYHLFYKYFPRLYPSPRRGMPDHILHIASEIVDTFDSSPVDPTDPMIRDVGWITIESSQETSLRQRRDPDIVFFQSRNPGYKDGHGLLTLIPVTLPNVLGAIAMRLFECARIALGLHRPHL